MRKTHLQTHYLQKYTLIQQAHTFRILDTYTEPKPTSLSGYKGRWRWGELRNAGHSGNLLHPTGNLRGQRQGHTGGQRDAMACRLAAVMCQLLFVSGVQTKLAATVVWTRPRRCEETGRGVERWEKNTCISIQMLYCSQTRDAAV